MIGPVTNFQSLDTFLTLNLTASGLSLLFFDNLTQGYKITTLRHETTRKALVSRLNGYRLPTRRLLTVCTADRVSLM